MQIYTREEAIALLKNDGKDSEIYAWAPQLETDKSFGFVVIFREHGGWCVALHNKIAQTNENDFFDEVDALESFGPTLPGEGCRQLSEFTTVEQALDFVIDYYRAQNFMDYACIVKKYKDRYLYKG